MSLPIMLIDQLQTPESQKRVRLLCKVMMIQVPKAVERQNLGLEQKCLFPNRALNQLVMSLPS